MRPFCFGHGSVRFGFGRLNLALFLEKLHAGVLASTSPPNSAAGRPFDTFDRLRVGDFLLIFLVRGFIV